MSSTIISRLQLDHPDLGTAGGASLLTAIRALYTKLGDNINSRFFIQNALANAASQDFEHNFKCAFNELRYVLYIRGTGTGELTRVDSASTPPISQFTISATPGFTTTKIRVLNSSGSSRDIALVVVQGLGAEVLDDLEDVDLAVAPQDGQALVYEASSGLWKPGASGDSSFKIQTISTPNATIKGGYILLDDGREIATYDGSGTAATDFGTDLTVNLTTVFGSTPANATTYYLYLDLLNLGSEVTIDNGRKVYSVAATDTTKFYLSTTKPEAINKSRYAVIGFVKSATSGNAWSGTGAAFGTVASKKHDNGPVAVNPIVYNLPKQVVGSIGSSGQIVAGHVLTSASFPSTTSTSNTSIYNLVNGSPVDAYGGRDLTATGSPTGDTSILGVASAATALNGSTQYLSSSNAFFNAGDNDFVVGGWFKYANWATGAATQVLMSNTPSGTDCGFDVITIAGTALLRFYYPISATAQGSLDIAHGFANGTWHHVAVKYTAATDTWTYFLDGAIAGSVVQANRAQTSTILVIGANPAGFGSKFTGSIDEFFFTKQVVSDEEIRKLYAAKISHAANVATAYQNWSANIYSKVATQDKQSWLVDKTDKDNLFVDFSGLGSTDSVEIMMENTGLTPVIVSPVPPFDQTYTSAPTFPITHGQPVVPEVMIMQEIASGSWETITAEGLVAANSTTLTGSVSALFTNGATKVRIIAKSPQNDATGVTQASGGNYGLVSYREDDTSMASVTFAGNLGGSQSSAIAIKITKIGRMVTLTIPQLVTVVPTGNSITLVTATALPTWARPLVTVSFPFIPADNGTYTANAVGQMDIQTSGIIRAYKNATGTAPWTNSANAGWVGAFSVSYPV